MALIPTDPFQDGTEPIVPERHRRCHEDLRHPYVWPVAGERPEPYYGTLKIVSHCPSPDGSCTYVRYADGRYDTIANGFLPDGYGTHHNGPRFMPGDDIRGDISNSEGMDAMNFWFNNSDNGANF